MFQEMQGIAVIYRGRKKYFLERLPPDPPPPTLNAIPHQTFCYQQTIYHFSILVIVWSLFVNGPPPEEVG
jgi:hypothetical protein